MERTGRDWSVQPDPLIRRKKFRLWMAEGEENEGRPDLAEVMLTAWENDCASHSPALRKSATQWGGEVLKRRERKREVGEEGGSRK